MKFTGLNMLGVRLIKIYFNSFFKYNYMWNIYFLNYRIK